MKNVGKTMLLDGEQRRRSTSDVVWTSIWLFCFIVWNSFLITQAIIAECFWSSPTKDIAAIIFASNIPNVVFLSGIILMIKKSEYVRTIEFLIHSYDRWNFNEQKYETLYITERVCLHSKYFYFWHTRDEIDKMTPEELQEHCESINEETYGYYEFTGYKSKEEAMKSIVEKVKFIVSAEKEKINVKVKNVNTIENFTLEELKDRYESGEFDGLVDKK